MSARRDTAQRVPPHVDVDQHAVLREDAFVVRATYNQSKSRVAFFFARGSFSRWRDVTKSSSLSTYVVAAYIMVLSFAIEFILTRNIIVGVVRYSVSL